MSDSNSLDPNELSDADLEMMLLNKGLHISLQQLHKNMDELRTFIEKYPRRSDIDSDILEYIRAVGISSVISTVSLELRVKAIEDRP